MGHYVNVVAKKGLSRQINETWRNDGFDGFLIYDKETILGEIEFMRNDPGQIETVERLGLKTANDWNRCFPAFSEGKGQVFIVGESDGEHAETLRSKVKFILDNRFLFETVSGLDDARDVLDMEIAFDGIDEKNRNTFATHYWATGRRSLHFPKSRKANCTGCASNMPPRNYGKAVANSLPTRRRQYGTG